MKKFLFIALMCLQTSCTSVQMAFDQPDEKTTIITSFTHYSHYFLFGLVGSDTLDLNKTCMNGKPIQVKNYSTFEDILFTVVSCGLYTPKSTKIWCELPSHTSQAGI